MTELTLNIPQVFAPVSHQTQAMDVKSGKFTNLEYEVLAVIDVVAADNSHIAELVLLVLRPINVSIIGVDPNVEQRTT